MSDSTSQTLKDAVMEQLDRGNASKRARAVAAIILERGSCTTSDLEALGYKHSPRAVRDLKEAGITIQTVTETYLDQQTSREKRRAKYSIVGTDPTKKSRHQFSKRIRHEVNRSGRCEVCGSTGRLQVDHRIPFEIGGESYPHKISELMPLCPSCNRAKSWDCEHCINWTNCDPSFCSSCMWSHPRQYKHVAGKEVREIRLVLQDEDLVRAFDSMRPNVRQIIENWLRNRH